MGASLCCMKKPSVSSPRRNYRRYQETSSTLLIIKSPEKVPVLVDKRDYGNDHEENGEEVEEKRMVGGSSTLAECLLFSSAENSFDQDPFMNPTTKVQIIKSPYDGSLTLKECLLAASPDNNHHVMMNPTKVQVVAAELQQSPNRIMISPEIRTVEFFTPRISFSSEKSGGKLEKVDEKEEEGVSFTPVLKRSDSQKTKKRVSFRFPEEADIFIFYSSPKANCEEN